MIGKFLDWAGFVFIIFGIVGFIQIIHQKRNTGKVSHNNIRLVVIIVTSVTSVILIVVGVILTYFRYFH